MIYWLIMIVYEIGTGGFTVTTQVLHVGNFSDLKSCQAVAKNSQSNMARTTGNSTIYAFKRRMGRRHRRRRQKSLSLRRIKSLFHSTNFYGRRVTLLDSSLGIVRSTGHYPLHTGAARLADAPKPGSTGLDRLLSPG